MLGYGYALIGLLMALVLGIIAGAALAGALLGYPLSALPFKWLRGQR